MKTYESVDAYMKSIGMRYLKNSQEFIAYLAYNTNKAYAQEVGGELNARAEGAPKSSRSFYELKNRTLEGSLCISAAFDGGVFRHIGNIIIDAPELFSGKVLDVCCDCGIVTCFMAQQYPQAQFVGVDINKAAIENAKALAQNLHLQNVEFICADVYALPLETPFDTVTSFRSLLDAAEEQTAGLNYIGERSAREQTYQEAFAPFAAMVAQQLKEGGRLLSVERYASEYGWLGWLQALKAQGISADARCELMRAQDISSVKEYSVTYAEKGEGVAALAAFEAAMAKEFKSGTGYDGGMAEFALYYDSEGVIEICEVRNRKSGRIIHQFSFATAKNGKRMYYDASNDTRRIKYYNEKKEAQMRRTYEDKLALYTEETYEKHIFNINE